MGTTVFIIRGVIIGISIISRLVVDVIFTFIGFIGIVFFQMIYHDIFNAVRVGIDDYHVTNNDLVARAFGCYSVFNDPYGPRGINDELLCF